MIITFREYELDGLVLEPVERRIMTESYLEDRERIWEELMPKASRSRLFSGTFVNISIY